MKKHFKVLCSDRLVLMLTTRAKFAQETDVALRQRPFWMRIMHSEHQSEDNSSPTGRWTDWFGEYNYQKVNISGNAHL